MTPRTKVFIGGIVIGIIGWEVIGFVANTLTDLLLVTLCK